jgi:lipopolysaccharide cholinephosphotransferase
MRLNNYFNTKYVYKISHPNGGIYPIERNIFEDVEKHKFEDYYFYIPKNYDKFLRDRYGDYMKIPPEASIYECCGSIIECKL